MARSTQQQQDTPETPTAPPTRTYRILVTKLGSDNSAWVEGAEVQDSDAPTLDWNRLVKIGAVALVRDDGSVVLPPDVTPPKPAPTAAETQDAPATTTEYHGGTGTGAPDGDQAG
jgi:hypothetical protein